MIKIGKGLIAALFIASPLALAACDDHSGHQHHYTHAHHEERTVYHDNSDDLWYTMVGNQWYLYNVPTSNVDSGTRMARSAPTLAPASTAPASTAPASTAPASTAPASTAPAVSASTRGGFGSSSSPAALPAGGYWSKSPNAPQRENLSETQEEVEVSANGSLPENEEEATETETEAESPAAAAEETEASSEETSGSSESSSDSSSSSDSASSDTSSGGGDSGGGGGDGGGGGGGE